jgi:uncharacterized membrane protein
VYDRLTLATASGWPFALLAFHVAMGATGFVSGSIAIAARKGGTWHRGSGKVFVASMIAMGLSAVSIALYEGKDDVAGGALTAYLVLTAWLAINPLKRGALVAGIPLMAFALVAGSAMFARGLTALGMPGGNFEGVPAGMHFFLGTVFVLAAVGDGRMMRAGGIQGTRRLARHLWRMCFGLFIATGSFVAQLVRMSFIPGWMKSLPVILVLSAGPIVVLLWWMWRIRWKQNLRGVVMMQASVAP